MRKPTRSARRLMKRHPHGRGKSRGKGKRRFQFMTEMTDADLEEVYFKGRGKRGGGKGFRRSTGKGRGRRRNPIGVDGNVMRCGICNSDTHFRAQCPQNQNINHSHGFAAVPAEQTPGPLGDLVYAFVTDREGDVAMTPPPPPPPTHTVTSASTLPIQPSMDGWERLTTPSSAGWTPAGPAMF